MSEPEQTVVILTASPIEYAAVRIHLDNLREEVHPQQTIYERGTFTTDKQSWEVGIVQISAGNAEAAIQAERAIAYFKPTLVFFVGIAVGFKGVAAGDVVVATKVYDYESGKARGTSFQSRPDVGKSSYRLVERAKAEARKTDWRRRIPDHIPGITSAACVHVGPIAAGEKIISSTRSTIFRFIQANFGDTLGVEMEGRGFLLAAHENEQVQALIVRGIADLINTMHTDDTQILQSIAAHHASAFAFEILAKLDVPQASSSKKQVDLRLVDLYINENDDNPVLDITLRNEGTQDALPLRARIDILDIGKFYYCDEEDIDFARLFLVATHTYTINLSPADKGRSKIIKIAHILTPGETDRFQLVIDQDVDEFDLAYVWYYLKVTVIYNEQDYALESMPILLSVPPADFTVNVVWRKDNSICAQKNMETLGRMNALDGRRSSSVEEAIKRYL